MKRYEGRRTPGGCEVTVSEDGGEPRPLDPRLDLRRHSPTGYSWGYAGSGPAQLSLALLADALGDDDRAQALYQDYKFRVIGRLAGDHFELTAEQIRETAAQLEAERGRKRS